MHERDDDFLVEYDEDERRLFDALPREAAVRPGDVDPLVHRLRAERLLHRRAPLRAWGLASAAVLLFVAGALVGSALTRRNSLEDLLARRNLPIGDRVLLLQRAGSAYVQAAQGYASATAGVDSSAVEVASRVLMGAAHAVARNGLDAGLSARLTQALEPGTAQRKPVIWY